MTTKCCEDEAGAKEEYLPPISDERLLELYSRIKPVVTFPGKGKCFLKPMRGKKGKFMPLLEQLRGMSYTWDPKAGDEAPELEPIRDVKTYHTWAYYGFFKPTIAEVLANIPKDVIDEVVAFEIIKAPETADDFAEEDGSKRAFNAGFHWAITRLYKLAT